MKRFEFRLERVVAWRDEQLDVEESRLHQFQAELQNLETRRTALESEKASAARALVHAACVSAEDLYRQDRYLRYAGRQRELIAGQKATAERNIAEQRTRVLEARKKLELLKRLRARRLAAWTAEHDRDLEQQAAEAHLIRTHRT
jgi:flagellar export protein FliJ